MLVKDVMIPVVGHVEPDMTMRDAAERMKSLNLSPMPVVENDRVVGLLTEKAVMELAATDGLAAGSHHVRDIMSTEVVCCSAGQEVADALRHLDEGSPARVPVIDDEKRLVGIVSFADLRKRERLESGEETAVSDVESISDLVDFDDDRVDYMSDSSFPASDPIPPPTTLGSHAEHET